MSGWQISWRVVCSRISLPEPTTNTSFRRRNRNRNRSHSHKLLPHRAGDNHLAATKVSIAAPRPRLTTSISAYLDPYPGLEQHPSTTQVQILLLYASHIGPTTRPRLQKTPFWAASLNVPSPKLPASPPHRPLLSPFFTTALRLHRRGHQFYCRHLSCRATIQGLIDRAVCQDMAERIEARSLASLNLLAANPPQYPSAPVSQRQDPVVLYISRVPGSRGQSTFGTYCFFSKFGISN